MHAIVRNLRKKSRALNDDIEKLPDVRHFKLEKFFIKNHNYISESEKLQL